MAETKQTDHGQRVLGGILAMAGVAAGIAGLVLLARSWSDVDPHGWATPSHFAETAAVIIGLMAMVGGGYLYTRGAAAVRTLPALFLTPEEETRVVTAIESFEKRTSGELRVHLEPRGEADILSDAKRTFERLGLTATRERNAVLFFVEVKERRFAVLGDEGIDKKVPAGFWDAVVGRVSQRFHEGRFGEGLAEGISMAGEQLAQHFPPRADDVNELPNQISRG